MRSWGLPRLARLGIKLAYFSKKERTELAEAQNMDYRAKQMSVCQDTGSKQERQWAGTVMIWENFDVDSDLC